MLKSFQTKTPMESDRGGDYDFLLFGTLLPFFRAFERPFAIACLRLLIFR